MSLMNGRSEGNWAAASTGRKRPRACKNAKVVYITVIVSRKTVRNEPDEAGFSKSVKRPKIRPAPIPVQNINRQPPAKANFLRASAPFSTFRDRRQRRCHWEGGQIASAVYRPRSPKAALHELGRAAYHWRCTIPIWRLWQPDASGVKDDCLFERAMLAVTFIAHPHPTSEL